MNLSVLAASLAWCAMGWTMLHLVWVGAVIGLLAAVLQRLTKSFGPEIRHAAALLLFLCMAISPVVIFLVIFEPRSQSTVLDISPAIVARPVSPGAFSVSEDSKKATFSTNKLEMLASGKADGWRLESVIPYLPAFWLAGSFSTFFLLAAGLIGVHRLRRSSRLLETGAIPDHVRVLAGSVGIARRVSVGICDRLAVPVLVGIVRPLILLPPAALCGWSVQDLEMVLMHELAHLRRWDNVVNLLQRIVESLLFFHPVVWWLSARVRLERELCCDRIVVGQLGQPFAYAELLVTLAGPGHGRRAVAVAMADRQVMTRIRRLFNLEDRSMKLTMPEGLGLVGALLAGASLVFGLQAAQLRPDGESKDSVRQALRKAVDQVDAIPRAGLQFDATTDTLANIAKAQLRLGDRDGALATLQRAYQSIDQFDRKTNDWEIFGTLSEVAKGQREAGDPEAARKTLDRLVQLVESLKDFSKVEDLVRMSGTDQPRREKHEVGAVIRSELLVLIADERLALGDREAARALYKRSIEAIGSQKGYLKPIFLAGIGSKLYQTGDSAGGTRVIDQAQGIALELTDAKEKEGALAFVSQTLVEIGELDRALAMVRALEKGNRPAALRRIVESFAEDDYRGAWNDPGGIKIVIGADAMKVKDKAATRTAMPRIADAVRETGNALLQVRTLSTIANLQAQSGDFTGARRTAEQVPNIKRSDFPGPSDGFYDAIKPATLAINARLQHEAGDKAGASEGFRQAIALSREIVTGDQKLIAQIFITQKQIECGDFQGARLLVQEATAFALKQPEPARSRGLAMLVESQAKAGDPIGAAAMISAIRQYPGLEKRRALGALADWYEKAGDRAKESAFLRQELELAEAKGPVRTPAVAAKVKPAKSFSARSFVDFESEHDDAEVEQNKLMASIFMYARLGEQEKALRLARTLPAGMIDVVMGNLAGNLAHHGDVAGAFKLAASLETPQQRLMAFDLAALAVGQDRARR